MEEMLTSQNWIQFGAFCVLFVALFIYTIKRFEKDIEKANLREDKLNEIIQKNQAIMQELTQKLDVTNQIKADVDDIKVTLKVMSSKKD
jgi:esterase/lipase